MSDTTQINQVPDISCVYVDSMNLALIDCSVLRGQDLFKAQVLPPIIHVATGNNTFFFRPLCVKNYAVMRQLVTAQKLMVDKGALVESVYKKTLKRFWGVHKLVAPIWGEDNLKAFVSSFGIKDYNPPAMTPDTAVNWLKKLEENNIYIIDPAEDFQLHLPLVDKATSDRVLRETMSLGNIQGSEAKEKYTKGQGVQTFLEVTSAIGTPQPPIQHTTPLTEIAINLPVSVDAEALSKAAKGQGPLIGHVIETGQAVVLVSQGVVEPVKNGKIKGKSTKKYVAPTSVTSGNVEVVKLPEPTPPVAPRVIPEKLDECLPGDPIDKAYRVKIMQAAINRVSSIYPPHCFPWLRIERRDLLGLILKAEIELEYAVVNGTPQNVIDKGLEYTKVCRAAIEVWQAAHENEVCERCKLEGHGITKPSIKTSQRLCPWCLVIVEQGAPCYNDLSPLGETPNEHPRQNALSDIQREQPITAS